MLKTGESGVDMKIVRYKNRFIFLIIISLICVGCQWEKEHLSDVFDLKNDKLVGVYDPEYSSTIVQNA